MKKIRCIDCKYCINDQLHSQNFPIYLCVPNNSYVDHIIYFPKDKHNCKNFEKQETIKQKIFNIIKKINDKDEIIKWK